MALRSVFGERRRSNSFSFAFAFIKIFRGTPGMRPFLKWVGQAQLLPGLLRFILPPSTTYVEPSSAAVGVFVFWAAARRGTYRQLSDDNADLTSATALGRFARSRDRRLEQLADGHRPADATLPAGAIQTVFNPTRRRMAPGLWRRADVSAALAASLSLEPHRVSAVPVDSSVSSRPPGRTTSEIVVARSYRWRLACRRRR